MDHQDVLTNAKHGEEDDVDYQLPDCSSDIYLTVSGSVHLPGGPHTFKMNANNKYLKYIIIY